MSVRPVGFRQLQAELVGLAERAQDPRPVLEEVAEDFRQAERAHFARGRFAPLDPAYAARKAATGHGNRIGVYSGGLLDSLTREGDRYHVERVRADGLEVGTRNPVANLFNGKHRTRNQPRRKAIGLTPRIRRAMLQKVADYLTGGDR